VSHGLIRRRANLVEMLVMSSDEKARLNVNGTYFALGLGGCWRGSHWQLKSYL
jgi:hypothetical protein